MLNVKPQNDKENNSLCTTCQHDVKTCDPDDIVWGIDIDPSATGSDGDKIVQCDMYAPMTDLKPNAALSGAADETRRSGTVYNPRPLEWRVRTHDD
jgi:hypothetical protein